MNSLTTTQQRQLPDTITDLAKFVLVGRDKLQAVKAEIHAINKVGLAKEVYQQKLNEAQEIAEVVTDAECRMGELLKAVPKATKGTGSNQYERKAEISPQVDFSKPKSQVIKESGITQRQAEHFQYMASHPESVEKAKAKAREQGVVLSRSAVIDQIRNDTKPKDPLKEMERQAAQRHEAFDTSGKTVSFVDLQQDKEDRKTIGTRAYISISKSFDTVDGYVMFKQDHVRCITEAVDGPQVIHFKAMIKRQIKNLEKILELLGDTDGK